jgi:mono/diheme cytochrome c family protein
MRASPTRRVSMALPLAVLAGWLAMNASLVFGQQAGSANGRRYPYALQEAPAKAQARANPLEGEPDAIEAGGKLFEEHCAQCHGRKAEGTRRAPSLVSPEVRRATPGAIFWVLTNGVVRRGMPVWSKLPEPERWQIVAFLKSFHAEQNNKTGEWQ